MFHPSATASLPNLENIAETVRSLRYRTPKHGKVRACRFYPLLTASLSIGREMRKVLHRYDSELANVPSSRPTGEPTFFNHAANSRNWRMLGINPFLLPVTASLHREVLMFIIQPISLLRLWSSKLSVPGQSAYTLLLAYPSSLAMPSLNLQLIV